MAVNEDVQKDFMPQKTKSSKEDKRRKNITPGSLMKAIIRPGAGTEAPADGDQIIFHCTTRTLDGVIVESTRSEHGGKGNPLKYVLGKSKMILGWCEGIPSMLKGEVAMLKVKPELHYGEADCPVVVPEGFPKNDELHFEIELIDFFKVKVISEDLGVVKKIINEGQGWESPREPYEIKCWIIAMTSDGKPIMSHTQGDPFHFTIGKNEVPKGLEMGLGSMTRGEKATIYVSSIYLTQSRLMPMVEGHEEVQFEVELVQFIQVRDMLGDGRLIKRRIVDGQGEFPMDCPLHDSLLRVHYKGMLLHEEKRVFYDTRVDNNGQPLVFSSGEGLVPEGLEMCVRLMLPGEVALVTCPPDYAYDKFVRPDNVPEGAYIQWEIELLGFEMPKDWTGLSFKEIMDDAEKIKGTGNRLFKEGKFELAKAKYDKVLREFNHVNPQDDEEGKTFLSSRNSLHLNVAACYQKMGEYKKSIEACNKVLDTSPAHVKALYRRGIANMSAGDFDEARNDFKMMITVDKSSEPDATAALSRLKQKEQEVEEKARKQFKGLFDKKPGEIADVGNELREGENPKEKDEGENLDKEKDGEVVEPDGDESERSHEAAPMGLFARFWPVGGRMLNALGLQKCSIL